MAGAHKVIRLLVFFALAEGAAAQAASWEDLVAAGQSAFEAGAYDQAGEHFSAALRIAETFSEADPRLATTANNLAAAYYMDGDYAVAEPMFRRALSIRERSLGPDHVDVATGLNNIAALYRKQGDPAAAVAALERARSILERALGPTHPRTTAIVKRLDAARRDLGQYEPAEASPRDPPDFSDQESQETALPGTTERNGQVDDAVATPELTAHANADTGDAVGDHHSTRRRLFYLQLISLQVEDRVQAEWLRLQAAHADVLGDLRADIASADLDDRGVWYRLQAGPLADFDLAAEACATLADSNQACLVVER